jgi:hypothetical protein
MMIRDGKPYLEVKKARIARAGKQVYTAAEVAARGLKPAKVKDYYVEYRPPEVLLRNMSKFNMLVLTNDHTPVDVAPENWKDFAVGFVGSSAHAEVLDSGEIFVVNDVVFYDQAAYDAYKEGKEQISAGYDSLVATVKNPDEVGYDFVLTDIPEMNHVALCDRARAGPNARVLDSLDLAEMAGRLNGGNKMGAVTSILAAFGIGKAKDSAFSLSKTVMDSITRVAVMDAAALEKGLGTEVAAVMQHLAPLGSSEDKGSLVATVADSFKNAKAVLEKKEEIGKVIDALYEKCVAADQKAAEALVASITGKTQAADSEEAKKKAEEEKKKAEEAEKNAGGGKKTQDQLIDEAFKGAMAAAADSIAAGLEKQLPGIVDAAVKKALGQDSGAGSPPDNRSLDSLDGFGELDGDPSFLLKGAFPTAW